MDGVVVEVVEAVVEVSCAAKRSSEDIPAHMPTCAPPQRLVVAQVAVQAVARAVAQTDVQTAYVAAKVHEGH